MTDQAELNRLVEKYAPQGDVSNSSGDSNPIVIGPNGAKMRKSMADKMKPAPEPARGQVSKALAHGESRITVVSTEDSTAEDGGERDRLQYNEYAAAHDDIFDRIESLNARGRAGLPIREHSFKALDDQFMQTLSLSRKFGWTDAEMEQYHRELKVELENAKLALRQANAMNKIGR